jgi:hypothetical protein
MSRIVRGSRHVLQLAARAFNLSSWGAAGTPADAGLCSRVALHDSTAPNLSCARSPASL